MFRDLTSVQILMAVLGLGALIAWHEFGHYLLARLCGMRVLKFSLGIGPRLFGATRNGIEYSVSAFLFGGYVRIFGMTPYEEGALADPRSYINRPRWQRILVIAAGPAFNYLLAFVLFAGLFWLYSAGSVRVQEVVPQSAAAKAGLIAGDVIARIDGEYLSSERDFLQRIQSGERLEMEIERERQAQLESIRSEMKLIQEQLDSWTTDIPEPQGEKALKSPQKTVGETERTDAGVAIEAEAAVVAQQSVPSSQTRDKWRALLVEAEKELKALEAAPADETQKRMRMKRVVQPIDDGQGRYLLGVRFQFVHDRRPKEVSISNVLYASALTCWQRSVDTLQAFGKIFQGDEGVELSGPLAIGQHISKAVERGARDYIWILAILSLTLGLFNLLPIPALDGIKILILTVESIIRRDISPALQVWMNAIGLILLLGLMVVMTVFDAAKIWGQ